jgi:hypothetical protein
MKMKSGNRSGYWWIETNVNDRDITSFTDCFAYFILNKTLAIVAFDGDSFVPSEDELKRGWIFKNEIAYFNNLNAEELKTLIFDNSYDLWLLFDEYTEFAPIDIYANYGGFTLADDIKALDFQQSLRERFWIDITTIKPSNFILCGDNFIYGTTRKEEIEIMKNEWC